MEPGEQLAPEAATGQGTNEAWHRSRMAGLPLAGHPHPWETSPADFDIGHGEKGTITAICCHADFWLVEFNFSAWYWVGRCIGLVYSDRVTVISPDEPSRQWRGENFEPSLREALRQQ